jgi:hypothetical protein
MTALNWAVLGAHALIVYASVLFPVLLWVLSRRRRVIPP